MNLTKKEISLIKDTDFLLTKSEIIKKLESIFKETESSIREQLCDISFNFPNTLNITSGKISKGENYNGLPYLVLDYPALFKENDIFAFRTMFWWGKFFSSTLHLQHKSLDYFREKLTSAIDKLSANKIFISVGETPWQYHYQQDNYQKCIVSHADHIKNCSFLKLSRKFSLDEYQKVPQLSTEFFRFLLNILK